MTIKQFLILFLVIGISVGVYSNLRYLHGLNIEKNTEPIENYIITEFSCRYSYKMSSSMTIRFKGRVYYVSLPYELCKQIEKGNAVPKIFYSQSKDVLFLEGYYTPVVYVYLIYILSIIFSLFGFIIYRKELNNHYSTM